MVTSANCCDNCWLRLSAVSGMDKILGYWGRGLMAAKSLLDPSDIAASHTQEAVRALSASSLGYKPLESTNNIRRCGEPELQVY